MRRREAMLLVLPIYLAVSFTMSGCVDMATPTDLTPNDRDADVQWLLVNPADATIPPGASISLTATAKDRSGNPLNGVSFQWETTDSLVARVSALGVVTGVSNGNAVLTATAGRVTTLATVEVGAPSASEANVWVSVAPATKELVVSQSFTLSSVVRDANGNPITGVPVSFGSSDANVASVTQAGVVRAVHAGEAVITAIGGTSRATALVDVLSSPVASVTLAPTSLTLVPGESEVLAATALDSLKNALNINSIVWASSSPAVATVDDSGTVMALEPGKTSITASVGSVQASSAVTVLQSPPTTITLTPSATDLVVGSKVHIAAVVLDASGAQVVGAAVTWSSSNSAVAAVDGSGVVTGVSTGIASVRAQSGSLQAFAAVTVLTVPVSKVAVAPSSATISVGHTAAFSATIRDPQGNVLTGRVVTWSSGQPLVATASETGVVTATGPGVATIVATSSGLTGSATVTVPGNANIDLSNEPPNMAMLTDRDFSSKALNVTDRTGAEGWSPQEWKYEYFSIDSDPTAPRSPPGVAKLVYPAGKPTDPNQSFAPVTAWLPTPGKPHRIYVSFWLKVSSNWRGHNTRANKLMEVFIADHPHVVLGLFGAGTNPLRPSVAINGGPDARAGHYLQGNVSPTTTFSRGAWHRLEMVVAGNTPGQSNGQATWWLDGQLVGDYHDVMWVGSGESTGWIQLELQPIWGGRNDQLIATQYLWVDHIYASTGP